MVGVSCVQSISESQRPVQIKPPSIAEQQQTTNPKTGKIERVFVNLEAVYPDPHDPTLEFSFEELRARARGWSDRDWTAEKMQVKPLRTLKRENHARSSATDVPKADILIAENAQQDVISQNSSQQLTETAPVDDMIQGTKARKSKRTKVMEVRGETQTSMYYERRYTCRY